MVDAIFLLVAIKLIQFFKIYISHLHLTTKIQLYIRLQGSLDIRL